MNKGQLVDAIAKSSAVTITKAQIDAVLVTALDEIQSAVTKGDKVTLVGFGTFEVRDRAAREGRNPKTGEVLSIPACKSPAFSSGKNFKERVNANENF